MTCDLLVVEVRFAPTKTQVVCKPITLSKYLETSRRPPCGDAVATRAARPRRHARLGASRGRHSQGCSRSHQTRGTRFCEYSNPIGQPIPAARIRGWRRDGAITPRRAPARRAAPTATRAA
jgi:hypothetical protein